MYRPTISRSRILSANLRSFETLNVFTKCGLSPCARQAREGRPENAGRSKTLAARWGRESGEVGRRAFVVRPRSSVQQVLGSYRLSRTLDCWSS